jgi:hypothetical protein
MRRGPPHCEPQRAMFPPDPLPSDNTGGYNAVRRAHHAAGVSAQAEERGLCRAACVSWHGMARRLKEDRADDAGGRTSTTAASYAASLVRRSAHWRGVRLRRFGPIRCASLSASLWAAQRYPCTSVMVWSAPPTSSATADLVEPLRAAMCSAVDLPDGAGATSTVGDKQGRRTGRGEGRTRRCSWCSRRRARR